jgi:hypothetical protein
MGMIGLSFALLVGYSSRLRMSETMPFSPRLTGIRYKSQPELKPRQFTICRIQERDINGDEVGLPPRTGVVVDPIREPRVSAVCRFFHGGMVLADYRLLGVLSSLPPMLVRSLALPPQPFRTSAELSAHAPS